MMKLIIIELHNNMFKMPKTKQVAPSVIANPKSTWHVVCCSLTHLKCLAYLELV